jgi:hypothetical protein
MIALREWFGGLDYGGRNDSAKPGGYTTSRLPLRSTATTAAGRRSLSTDSMEVLEKKLGAVHHLYGKGENFRSVIYKDTGHEHLPEMKAEMLQWFERHLPVGK